MRGLARFWFLLHAASTTPAAVMISPTLSLELWNGRFTGPLARLVLGFLLVDTDPWSVFSWGCSLSFVPHMSNKNNRKNINEVLIKFVAPAELKHALQELANERNITLSALLRLITSEYVKRNRLP